MSGSARLAPGVLRVGWPSFRLSGPAALAIMAAVSVAGCAVLGSINSSPAAPAVTAPAESVVFRTMSVYSDKYVGRKMANGQPYDPSRLTVASNDWPLGTRLLLLRHGRSVSVTVTDRMHKRFSGIRVDASRAVWNLLTGSAKPGLRKVEVQK